MLVQSDNVQAVGEDMGTSMARRAYRWQSRSEVERPRREILQIEFSVRLPSLRFLTGNPSTESYLTPQPFPSKLRLSSQMHARTQRIRILAMLLGIIFLGAQFHFCTDFTATPSASHICPICSTAGSAVATHSLSVAIAPATNRLEIVSAVISISSAFPRATSPRAPPAF